MGAGPKYYVYISRGKVEMLEAQIPRSFFQRLGHDLNIGAFGLQVGVSKRKNEDTIITNLNRVIRYLEETNMIGDLVSGRPYVRSVMNMDFGQITSASNERIYTGIYFNGIKNVQSSGNYDGAYCDVTLAGSKANVTGMPAYMDDSPSSIFSSGIPSISGAAIKVRLEDGTMGPNHPLEVPRVSGGFTGQMEQLLTEEDIDDNGDENILKARYFTLGDPYSKALVEFVTRVFSRRVKARRVPLANGEVRTYEYLYLVGSPLYVAMADE